MADGDLLTPVVSDEAQHQSFKNLILEPRRSAREGFAPRCVGSIPESGQPLHPRVSDCRFRRAGLGARALLSGTFWPVHRDPPGLKDAQESIGSERLRPVHTGSY